MGEAGGSVPAVVVVLALRAHMPRCQKLGIQGQALYTLSVWASNWEICAVCVCVYVYMFTVVCVPH